MKPFYAISNHFSVDCRCFFKYNLSGDAMNIITYNFDKIVKSGDSKYIFQSIENRKLSDIYLSHDFYEFIVVLEGSCRHVINGVEKEADKNTCILLCPGDAHKITAQSDDVKIIAISVKNDELRAFEQAFGLKSTPLTSFSVKLSDRKLCYLKEFYGVTGEYEYKLFLANLIKIYADLCVKKENIPSALKMAVRDMKKSENLKAGSERFITLSGYSKTHLTRLMRKYYGVSVHEFIRDARLEAAYNSLVLTSLYPEDISEELGYSSFSHFQQIFKKKYGITPAMLRKKYSSITI